MPGKTNAEKLWKVKQIDINLPVPSDASFVEKIPYPLLKSQYLIWQPRSSTLFTCNHWRNRSSLACSCWGSIVVTKLRGAMRCWPPPEKEKRIRSIVSMFSHSRWAYTTSIVRKKLHLRALLRGPQYTSLGCLLFRKIRRRHGCSRTVESDLASLLSRYLVA